MNRMNIASLLAVALLASQVFGAVPNLINYQGVLTDDTGVVVADGSYKLTVRLYDVATGGSALFTESHDAVAVVDGVFSLSIGSVNTALGTLAFNDPYYLSLEVNDSGVELAPRVAIQAVPYALNTSSIAGTEVSGAAPALNEVLQFDGTQWIPAVVSGGGSDTDWVESGGNVYRATGNVGIGTTTPAEKLDVSGNVRATGNVTANGDVQGDQLVLTQPSGSSPMTISSNTLVSNLNADLLDGQQAADFLAAGSNLADLGDVSSTAPAANDVLQYDGSEWGPATVSAGGGDITSVVAGAGLTGGATSGDANLDVATGTGLQVTSDQVQLTTAYANGSAYDGRFVNQTGDTMTGNLIVNARVGVGVASPSEELEVQGDGRFLDGDGFSTQHLLYDGSVGGGGLFNVMRDSLSHVGFEVNGNWAGTTEPRVSVLGTARSVTMDMSLDGDSSVQLPEGSVNSLEMSEEAGIAQAMSTASVFLTSTDMVDIETISVTTPTAGYIVLEAKSVAFMKDVTGTNRLFAQIDETAGGTTNSPYWVRVGLNAYSSGVDYSYFPVYCTRTYYKSSAGTYTFRLEAAEDTQNASGNSCGLYHSILRATFYSTSYGSVVTVESAPGAPTDAIAPGESAPQNTTIVDLRELEIQATEARLRALEAERELQRAREGMTGSR